MKVLLTGVTGFIGSHLARALLADAVEVVGVTRRVVDAHGIAPGLRLHVHDGTTAGLARIVSQERPDVAVHLASLFVAEHQPEHIEPLIGANLLFGTQLADALTSVGTARLLNTGTSWQHFGDHAYDPVCLYAASKQAFESMLQYYVNARSLKLITLKLFDTYGPGDTRRKLFALLRDHCDTGRPLSMSQGMQQLDLVFIDDVVSAYRIALQRLMADTFASPESFGLCSGRSISLQQVVDVYASVTGKTPNIRWGERSYRAREVMAPWSGAPRLPGWMPTVSLEEGIMRMEGVKFHVPA